MTEKTVKNAITKEISFFDQSYFDSGRKDPKIVVYYSGHGQPNMIQLKDRQDYVTYEFIYKLFVETIDKHHKKDLDLKDKMQWFVEFYCDACHSGSALGEAKKFAEKFDHKALQRNTENNARYKIGAFDEKVKLELRLLTSATAA